MADGPDHARAEPGVRRDVWSFGWLGALPFVGLAAVAWLLPDARPQALHLLAG